MNLRFIFRKHNKKHNRNVCLKNPLMFDTFSDIKEYVNSLKENELVEFNNLVLTIHESLEKFRDFIYVDIRYHILESNDMSENNYKKMLNNLFNLGIGFINYYTQESSSNFRFNFKRSYKNIDDLKLSVLNNINNLIRLDEKNNWLSEGFVNRLNSFNASILINYSNECSRQVFGEPIDKSINSEKLPISSIGKKIDGKWDINSCIKTLKDQLIAAMFADYNGDKTRDLSTIIKTEYRSFSWIEGMSFDLRVKDANKIRKRLFN